MGKFKSSTKQNHNPKDSSSCYCISIISIDVLKKEVTLLSFGLFEGYVC